MPQAVNGLRNSSYHRNATHSGEHETREGDPVEAPLIEGSSGIGRIGARYGGSGPYRA